MCLQTIVCEEVMDGLNLSQAVEHLIILTVVSGHIQTHSFVIYCSH